MQYYPYYTTRYTTLIIVESRLEVRKWEEQASIVSFIWPRWSFNPTYEKVYSASAAKEDSRTGDLKP